MLKLAVAALAALYIYQPPSGGCVLKQRAIEITAQDFGQPPSGGCVLKRPAMPEDAEDACASRLQAAVC